MQLFPQEKNCFDFLIDKSGADLVGEVGVTADADATAGLSALKKALESLKDFNFSIISSLFIHRAGITGSLIPILDWTAF